MFIKTVLAAGFVLGLSTGLATSQTPKSDQLKPNISPGPQGRYQIVMSPHNARDTFLLDTETGRVWQLTVFSFLADDPSVWNLMPRSDDDGGYD